MLFTQEFVLTYFICMETQELSRKEWPKKLFEIPQLPERLWIRGTLPSPELKTLAVVGSRALSRYGQEACQKLIMGLSGYPISIISGLALGADACAHKAALAAKLHTIAVPGSGLNDSVIGPRANFGLAKDILKADGALLSEHEPNYVARPYDFPARNRIMVGLADAVLVIEAGEKSGTLITARLASEYNRDLLCVPHRIGDPHGFGPHLFIRLGATLVTEPLHILESLGIPPKERVFSGPPPLSGTELVLWNMLEEPRARDEILRASAEEVGEILTALVSLELKGIIKEEFGAWRRI